MDYGLFKSQLTKLVSYNSVQSTPEEGAPFGKQVRLCLDCFLDFAKDFGFETINYDGYAGEVIFGKGEDFGILCHLDIVPIGKPEDWLTPPFALTEKDEKLIGRGVLDDKGPALMILHALKQLKDEGFTPNKKIRLILGCNEESGWGCIDHLKSLNAMPNMGFSPDADFPVIYAEKGILHAEFCFDCNNLQISGGTAMNMVCDYTAASCPIDNTLIEKYGLTLKNGKILSFGKTAHASTPHKGENAIEKMLKYLEDVGCVSQEIRQKLFLNSTGILDLNDETGYLTLSPDLIITKDNKLYILCDIRYPATKKDTEIFSALNKIGCYEIKGHQKSLFADKNSPLVTTLLNAFESVSGIKSEPIAIGGGTYARSMNDCVAFGPVFYEEDAVCHEPNEYIKIKELLLGYQIYRQAIINICK